MGEDEGILHREGSLSKGPVAGRTTSRSGGQGVTAQRAKDSEVRRQPEHPTGCVEEISPHPESNGESLKGAESRPGGLFVF